ncbi:MAG: YihY/virulence factor BrkB family protein [Saprospiraceae bacterium]|nr:YihY/virulence factor BrkB family protein [Saprospiraceae bacterium]
MKQRLKNFGLLLKTSSKQWWARDPFKESAVIAYYAIFSLPGLLVVVMTVAGYFMGTDVAIKYLQAQISSAMGIETANQIHNMIVKAGESKNSVLAGILGIVTILIGATGVFVQFQKSLNGIWEVKADEKKSGILSILRARLFSFGLIMAIAFILMVSFVVTSVLVAMGDWLARQFSEVFLTVIKIVNFTVTYLFIATLFALMFKFFPDAKIKMKHVWLGSLLTAFLFLLGMFGMFLYFGKAEPGSGYGAAGSIILILIWVSYSSMIAFFGAEFTRAYAEMRDGNVPPDEHAVKIRTKT